MKEEKEQAGAEKVSYKPRVELLEQRIAPMSASGHQHRHKDPPVPGQ